MDKGKHKMDQNGTSPSILPGPLIHSIMDSNDHTHVVGVQLVSLGSGWSIELLLWRVPDVQKQWLGKATNDSMGARPDSVKNASNHKRRKHANVCCKCMPTCICYTYTYALHTHIYIYTETAFLGIHMTKPLCKTVSKKIYIYIYKNRSNIICKYDNYDFSSGVYVEIRQPSDRKLEPSALELLKSPSIPQWLSWLVLRILIPILSNPHFKSRWWFVIIHLDPPNTGKTR